LVQLAIPSPSQGRTAMSDEESTPKRFKFDEPVPRMSLTPGEARGRLADLKAKKKAAVKAEDFLLAYDLVRQIAAIEVVKAPKREAGTPTPRASKKARVEPLPAPVAEASHDPFFDNATPDWLAPKCPTAADREGIRAVLAGNLDFLKEKLMGTVPLLAQRDSVSRQTALHIAIQKQDHPAICTLARCISLATASRRVSSLNQQGTGQMSVLTLGFATGKIGAARGGKEMNNALLDCGEPPESLEALVARTPLTADTFKLLMGLQLGKAMVSARRGTAPFHFALDGVIEPSVWAGNYAVTKMCLERMKSFDVSASHMAAFDSEVSPTLRAGSITSKMRIGGGLSPIHLAALNPSPRVLEAMLKLEPHALTHQAPSGLQPVHVAAANQSSETLKMLLSDWNASRRAPGPLRMTPLHFAAAAGRAENVAVIMGGTGAGTGMSHSFAREIRTVLMRQANPVKINGDGIGVLSRCLIDLLKRVTQDAKKRAADSEVLGSDALDASTQEVLKGNLAPKIADTARKVMVGEVGLPKKESGIARALSEASDERVQHMFDAIDKNDDGMIDPSELEAAFRQHKIDVSKAALKSILKEMDSEGNGEICFDEFCTWVNAGSSQASMLRRQLVVASGDMQESEVAEAEASMADALLHNVDKLAFDVRELLEVLDFTGNEIRGPVEGHVVYASAMLECVCTKVLEVSANGARSQKKSTINAEHIVNGITANGDLQGLYSADSVVMNSLLLPAKNKQGSTALHLAAQHGHAPCVRMLVDCAADVNIGGIDRKTALALAAENGHVECMKILLAVGAKVDLPDKRKRSPLLLAVRAGRYVAASVLLHRHANPDAADDSGNSVVHYAAAFGWLGCLNLLHEAKANLSVANAMKLAPVTAALQKGHKTVFRRLLELGIHVNFRDANGSTILLSCLGAANRSVYDEVRFLMDKGADPTLASSQGVTPLHVACGAAARGCASYYVQHPDESARLETLQGWAKRPQRPAVPPTEVEEPSRVSPRKKLRGRFGRYHPSPQPQEEDTMVPGEVAPHKVYERGFHQLSTEQREAVFRLGWTKVQWQEGYNPTRPWEQLQDSEKAAAATLGLDRSRWKVLPVQFVTHQRGIDGKFPVTTGCALMATQDGMVSIQFATSLGSSVQQVHVSRVALPTEDMEAIFVKTEHVTVGIAGLLLEHKAVLDARDGDGVTPLMLALRQGSTDLVRLLVTKRADINAKANPLPPPAPGKKATLPPTGLVHLARCKEVSLNQGTFSRADTFRFLVANGAEVIGPASSGAHSPMVECLAGGRIESAKVLFAAGCNPRLDASGHNALHRLFVLTFELLPGSARFEMAASFAKSMLESEKFGTDLMSEHRHGEPAVTPLHSLVESFVTHDPTAHVPDVAERNRKIRERGDMLLSLLNSAKAGVNFAHWWKAPATPAAPPASPLVLLCSKECFAPCPDVGAAVVGLLCRRGINPNGGNGSPAALHSLCQRLSGDFTTSSLVNVLVPLTQLDSRMVGGATLLTSVVMTCVDAGKMDAARRKSVAILLDAKADPNVSEEISMGFAAPNKRTPLHFAALLRDEELTTVLLSCKASPAVTDRRGLTALHLAVSKAPTGSDANFDVEDILLRHKASIAAADSSGRTALHYAFMKHQDQSLDFDEPWLVTRVENNTSTTFWTAKAHAMLAGKIDPIETISSLCAISGANVNAVDSLGMSPLHLAAVRGASISCLKLVNAKANLEFSFHGNTPLGLALQNHPDVAVLLMQKNADTKQTCVMFGVDSSSRAVAGLGLGIPPFGGGGMFGGFGGGGLGGGFGGGGFGRGGAFRRAQISGLQHDQSTGNAAPLGSPESTFSLAIRQLSCRAGDTSGSAAGFLGAAITTLDCGFPLSKALDDTIASKQFVMLHTLIPKVGDAILRNQKFDGGQNLLHRIAAVASSDHSDAYFRVVSKLLERGVPFITADDGQTALHLAARLGSERLVGVLMSNPSCTGQIVSAPDKTGVAPLGHALRGSTVGFASVTIAQKLLSRGATARSALVDPVRKLYALSYCIVQGWSPSSTDPERDNSWPRVLFHSSSPSVASVDADGRSCLALAARSKRFGLAYLKLIVDWAGTEFDKLLDGKDCHGVSPLMHAVDCGNIGFAAALLDCAKAAGDSTLHGVVTATAADGRSALVRAVHSPDPVGMVCIMLRGMDAVALAKACITLDADKRTPLMHAVLCNNATVVAMLLQGLPVQPGPANTMCPEGVMAGGKRTVLATYVGCEDGHPHYRIDWPTDKIAVQRLRGDQIVSHECHLVYRFELTVPPGVGPGLPFTIEKWAGLGGPGSPGLAHRWVGQAPGRVPPPALKMQDCRGHSVAHLCVSPLPFGSFENTEILTALIRAKVPMDLRDGSGVTAGVMASRQRSGVMVACMKSLGIAAPVSPPSRQAESTWPSDVDVDADCTATLAAAQARLAQGKKPAAAVEQNFQMPSPSSTIEVASGTDGAELDLVMTKVDVAKGPYGQNVFYRMQVVHEKNQDNYFLFTRWGRVGDRGQFQTTPFESLAKAATEFCKIFKAKSGNDWYARSDFTKQTGKYQLHKLRQPNVKIVDALQMEKWVRKPATVTPWELRKLVNAGSDPVLLRTTLAAHNVDQPLGSLAKNDFGEAGRYLLQIKGWVARVKVERRKPVSSGDILQELADKIAVASNRIYELVPTRNFQHTNVGPIDSEPEVNKWIQRLAQVDDISIASKLLLGAQHRIAEESPTDYLYRALKIRAQALDSDSPELQLLEQFINRSQPGSCCLFSGPGAVKLPDLPPGQKKPLQLWQASCDTPCYTSSKCDALAKVYVVAGGCYSEYAKSGDAICIKEPTGQSDEAVWVRTKMPGGAVALRALSDREVNSQISAVYKFDRKSEGGRGGGEGAQLLFHGSGVANVLSILQSGLRIKPAGAMHHGSAFGNGIYFANAFAKSRSYCSLHQGVGFLLLCEVSTGSALESSAFTFQQSVREALLAKIRKKMILPQGVDPRQHAEYKEAVATLDTELANGVENLEGTGFDSFYFNSGAGPDPNDDVVHPDGYRVPSGRIVRTTAGTGEPQPQDARDEIIVYDQARVRVRYLVELREAQGILKEVPKSNPDTETLPGVAAPESLTQGSTHGTPGAGEEEDDEEDDDDEDADEDQDIE